MSWKIVRKDNFDREGPGNEIAVAENIQSESGAVAMCNGLRAAYGSEDNPYWHLVLPQHYKLRKFEP